tara:strand:+ start:2763 stop:2948 length:186 start_codon:yes stop_codon:yes gene_type:complete
MGQEHISSDSDVKRILADRTRDTRTVTEIREGKPYPQYLALLVEKTVGGETIYHPLKEPEE